MQTKETMPGTELSDALALEKNRFMRFIADAQSEARTEVAALERQLAARGLALSGARYAGEMDLHLRKAWEVIEKAMALRRELGRMIPELLERQHLELLRSKLNDHINGSVAGFVERLSSQSPDPGGAVRDALRSRSELEAVGLKAKLNSELQALGLEARLGLHREEIPMMTFNIANSTIANLNLGMVVGDLTASVQALSSQGQTELASVIRGLAEAITASKELRDSQRKELLEHLSFVSTEIALPLEKRKMGPLRTSLAVLQATLSAVGQLATVWTAAEPALKAVGLLQ
jgi:hypothetical protein